MSIKINIHSLLREFTDDRDVVEVDGSTVGECLTQLIQRYPAIKEKILKSDEELLNTTEILVNGEDPYPEYFTTSVSNGDVIHLIMMFGCVS